MAAFRAFSVNKPVPKTSLRISALHSSPKYPNFRSNVSFPLSFQTKKGNFGIYVGDGGIGDGGGKDSFAHSVLGNVLGVLLFLKFLVEKVEVLKIVPKRIMIGTKMYLKYAPTRENITLFSDKNWQNRLTKNYPFIEYYMLYNIPKGGRRYQRHMSDLGGSVTYTMEGNEMVLDTYEGIEVIWRCFWKEKKFELRFPDEHEEIVDNEYFPFVIKKGTEFRAKYWELSFFEIKEDNVDKSWRCDESPHGMSFDMFSSEPELKANLIDALTTFLLQENFFTRTKKPRVMTYLLSGPPGTGKSSLIEAMANFIMYDIYNLKPKDLSSMSYLDKMLSFTKSKSIIVINDIDSRPEISVAAVMDSLRKQCHEGLIVVFTMNHQVKNCPNKFGRVNKHIDLPYCSPAMFEDLAFSILEIKEHPRLFPRIKGLVEAIPVTPGEIVDMMVGAMTTKNNPELALQGVVDYLEKKMDEMPKWVRTKVQDEVQEIVL